MSAKDFKRKLDQEVSSDSSPEAESIEGSVSYGDWFSTRLKGNKNLQPHHYPVLQTYFKNQNLSENEPESKYDAALRLFGF